jgi:hypothetical protein
MMMGIYIYIYIKGNTKVAFCEISFGWLTLERLGILAGIVIGVIAMAISKHALTISKWGILPDIELRYEIKKIAPEYITDPIQQHFINNNSEAYGDFYSHLTLFNGGNGKASNIKTEYNWIVSGRKGGISEDAIKKAGHKLLYDDYLFPGQEQVSVPALEYRSPAFEEAERILIKVRYKDVTGFNHCRCVEFVSIHGERGFNMDPESHNCCGWVSRCFKKITRKCNFREDVCSVEGLIPILEEEGAR